MDKGEISVSFYKANGGRFALLLAEDTTLLAMPPATIARMISSGSSFKNEEILVDVNKGITLPLSSIRSALGQRSSIACSFSSLPQNIMTLNFSSLVTYALVLVPALGFKNMMSGLLRAMVFVLQFVLSQYIAKIGTGDQPQCRKSHPEVQITGKGLNHNVRCLCWLSPEF